MSEQPETISAVEVLTGRSGWMLTNCAVPPAGGAGGGGGLGGSWQACAGGDVRLTYSDRPISSWGKHRSQPIRGEHNQGSARLLVRRATRRLEAKTVRGHHQQHSLSCWFRLRSV